MCSKMQTHLVDDYNIQNGGTLRKKEQEFVVWNRKKESQKLKRCQKLLY